jgi:mannose/fructose/N-acetylgalactosamine-specific phosphotransferase system component IID
MYLVLIAWFYVTLMMAIAEATSSNGTLLGAFFTLVLYGLLPIIIVGYILGTPARRKAREKLESLDLDQKNNQENRNK